jgi:DNA-3-methyladenine glycosylase
LIKLKIIYVAKEIKKLGLPFYQREEVTLIARELLGKILVTRMNGVYTSGRIVETEAYAGVTDRASHAFGNRRTPRTEVMYGRAATSYVYLCYGIHHLFNVVTASQQVPHAVLIRALEPVQGIAAMMRRTSKQAHDLSLTRGPGNLSRALGLDTQHSGLSLLGNKVFILDDGFSPTEAQFGATARIGVEFAGADAHRPWRFILKGSKYLSGKPSVNLR